MADHAQDETQKSLIQRARRLFAQPANFVCAATEPAHFSVPKQDLPEIAFVGRSNVGKSSLINALTGRKGLARASNTPGRTQQIIFFDIGSYLRIVDLPGYGHAKAPADVQKQWTGLMRVYLQKRSQLALVCVLIDARHGLMAKDHLMLDLLDAAAVSTQIILTKADLVKSDEAEKIAADISKALKKHPAVRPEVIITGAAKGQGLDSARLFLAEFAKDFS